VTHRDEVLNSVQRLAEELAADAEWADELGASDSAGWSIKENSQSETRRRFAQEDLLDQLCARVLELETVHVQPLADHEWVDVLNPEGNLLPRCCGVISVLRDTLGDLLRTPELGQFSTVQEKITRQGRDLFGAHPEILSPPLIRVLTHYGSLARGEWEELARVYAEARRYV
jgi:hypothetical protein